MRIGIIGGGAVGLLFASYLSDGYQVTLYTRTKEQADVINEEGILLIRENKKFYKKVSAMVSENIGGREDLLIVAVKQYHLDKLLPAIRESPSPLLFIQNGYSHIQMLEELPQRHIFLGVVEHGALKHSENSVEHTGEGVTKVAAYRGDLDPLQLLCVVVGKFPFVQCEDYRQMLLEKLIVNAVINPLTGILGIRNGELVENPYYYRLFKNYFSEISTILDLESFHTYQEHVEQVCRTTANNRSSLLKDLENRRKTEIDAILGYVISVAKEKNKGHGLASAVYWMVKGKEYQGDDRL
ncbi:2-dehydropantoate 2-reductase [Peribacillus cavernae]|nr:2-dehydropantoate 2-reductase [Peribacillus cavernae]MDQ0217185.1 2-dehydropantoate 2-reductase [Peribacillus cavernae]